MLLRGTKEAGFTLIEIMLTAMVVTVGAMFLMEGLSTNIAADVDIENKVIALNLVNEKIEEFKNLDFTDPVLDPGNHNENQVVLGFPASDNRNWTRDWIVANYQGSDVNQLKSIRVVVSWTYKGQPTRLSIESTTLMTNMTWAGS
jgi:prepilin-type N-terminal cleavage/methylation domain-containing protein